MQNLVEAGHEINIEQLLFLAGIFLANIGVITSSFLTQRDKVTKLEVKVDRLEKDVNVGWERLRNSNKEEN